MPEPNATNAAEWIAGLSEIVGKPQAGTLEIEGKRLEAVEYKRLFTPQGARNPAPYVRHFIYVLGTLSKVLGKRRGERTAIRIEGREHEWYVSCFTEKEQTDQYSPFGPCFQVCPWDDPMVRIDENMPKQYKRIPASFVPY
jgi:hypothetical protein